MTFELLVRRFLTFKTTLLTKLSFSLIIKDFKKILVHLPYPVIEFLSHDLISEQYKAIVVFGIVSLKAFQCLLEHG